MKDDSLEKNGIGFFGTAVFAVLSMPGFLLAIFGIYQGLRSAYCNYYFGNRDSFTAIWCSYTAYDFRADLTLLSIVGAILHLLVYFPVNREKTVSQHTRLLLTYIFLGVLGLVVNRVVMIGFHSKPWW